MCRLEPELQRTSMHACAPMWLFLGSCMFLGALASVLCCAAPSVITRLGSGGGFLRWRLLTASMLAAQVTLIPSSQMAYTYPYARGHLLYRRSRVELLKPDFEVRWIVLLCSVWSHASGHRGSCQLCSLRPDCPDTHTHWNWRQQLPSNWGHAARSPPCGLHGCSRMRPHTVADSDICMTTVGKLRKAPPTAQLPES